MSEHVTRRDLFLHAAAAAALGSPSGAAARPAQNWRPRKAVIYGMLPATLSPVDRLKLARDVGFEGIEAPPLAPQEAEALRRAADSAGVRIHSLIFGGWHAPLSSPDPEVVARGMSDVRTALHSAQIMGCDAILLVPAVVNAKTRYADAYTRSQAAIRQLIPEAQDRKVILAVEEVWNNFLLSPLEFARYVDEFRSPWVRAYFDVGNVVRFGWPQDWIRTLGRRIRKVHVKDFKGGPGLGTGGEWVNLLEGSIDWREVRAALMEVGFNDFLTLELGGGDEGYLRDLSGRLDRIIAGV